MGLSKAELEAINDQLQTEVSQLKEENRSLTDSLARANELINNLTERNKLLEAHYNQLREYVAGLTES